MKILVTGANGYIGRHIVKYLLDHDHEVIAADLRYDKVDERAKRSHENIFSGDKDIYNKLGQPDVCIHLAWRDGFNHGSDAHIMDLPKHYEFLKNMIQGGLKRLDVMGTMHEVGYHEGAIDETTPCNPMSMYGIAKNALREMLLVLTKNSDCKLTWTRAYYILGDDEGNHSIFTKILEAAKEGKTTFPFNSGKNQYDFISVTGLAKQISEVSIQDEVLGTINVCSGKPVALKDKVEEFIKERHLNISLDYGKFPDRPYDSPIVYGDVSKIQKILKK
ncbi:NAD(P)-dependent oxidoreductase [Sharpea azabuensis]|uniref:NAD(P)-dependent oxidoreductase n=1 Tax=Sharpea porci TaxID=2652286 RepID=A0A844FQJ6_9FIRM|nr:NAD(P)-dependent oxidoreductase [Sharpea porci]MST88208.1 NAD(P)-dependent oxidoreductase [Sharpea porci]